MKEKSIRCYARRSGETWICVCVDFSLAAQGQTFDIAKTQLNKQIDDYLYEAVFGEDVASADWLLRRKAPFSQRISYYLICFIKKLFRNTPNLLVYDVIAHTKS